MLITNKIEESLKILKSIDFDMIHSQKDLKVNLSTKSTTERKYLISKQRSIQLNKFQIKPLNLCKNQIDKQINGRKTTLFVQDDMTPKYKLPQRKIKLYSINNSKQTEKINNKIQTYDHLETKYQLIFPQRLNSLIATQVERLKFQQTRKKNQLIILNYMGLLTGDNTIFKQDFEKNLKIQNLEKIISTLGKTHYISIILNDDNFSYKIYNRIKNLQIDSIYYTKRQKNIYFDCNTIINDFENLDEIQYFSSINTSINNYQIDFCEKSFWNKLPKLFHENFKIYLFQNSIFQQKQDLSNTIINISQSNQSLKNKFIRIDDKDIFYQMKFIQQQRISCNLEKQIHKIKQNNFFIPKYENKPKGCNLQDIYFRINQKYQKKTVNAFLDQITDIIGRNSRFKQNYQCQNLNIMKYLKLNQNIEDDEYNFKLDFEFFNVIQPVIFLFIDY